MNYRARLLPSMMTALWLSSALSACQQHNTAEVRDEPDFAAQCQHEAQHDTGSCRYIKTLQWRIGQNFNQTAGYAGQRCQVTVAWDSRRQHYNVLATTGDEPLCLKAWQTIGSAQHLPAPPTSLPAQLVLNFTP